MSGCGNNSAHELNSCGIEIILDKLMLLDEIWIILGQIRTELKTPRIKPKKQKQKQNELQADQAQL